MLMLPGEVAELPSMISEKTASLEGIGFAVSRGLLTKSEAPKLKDALTEAYSELAAEYGETPTPVFRTLAERQAPDGFHVVVIPSKTPKPNRAAVYLHGYGGNFTLQCWLFARAVGPAGYMTVCPSTDKSGHWAEPSGRKIFDATLRWLAVQGKTELVLGGLSNGGAGAATLSKAYEAKFKALILISGVAGTGPEKLPVLVLHGERDASASYANAKKFVAMKANRTLITFEKGSHYAFLYERDAAAKKIASWLSRQMPLVPD